MLRLLALVAMAAQLLVAFSPLAEGRESRLGTHVEAAGIRAHFTHDEATCPVCQARSMQRDVAKPAVPLLDAPIRATAAVDVLVNGVVDDYYPHANPRAPPVVS
jgi:hypothetical protein